MFISPVTPSTKSLIYVYTMDGFEMFIAPVTLAECH